MVGSNNGFFGLCKQNDSFPTFIYYHCIIYQHALCGKSSKYEKGDGYCHENCLLNSYKEPAKKNFPCSLERGLGRAHRPGARDVRWLSRERYLERFRKLSPETKEFFNQFKDAEYAQHEDEQRLLDLAFLTGLTALLNELNLEVQEKEKNIVHMISSVNAFKGKLQLLLTKLQRHNLHYFQHLLLFLSAYSRLGVATADINYFQHMN